MLPPMPSTVRIAAALVLLGGCGGEPSPAARERPSAAARGEPATAPGEPAAAPPAAVDPPPLPPAWSADEGPHLRVLGTAQDGGLPHAACTCERCEAARADPTRARRIASIALVLPSKSQVFLFDATPDIRPQLHAVRDVGEPVAGKVDRKPVDGVFLTHAHLGHYTGLAFLGFEAVHAEGIPVYATPKMVELLGGNAPWDQLVRLGEIEPEPLAPGEPLRLGPVTVTPVEVPHRNEYADTVAFVVKGPRKKVLYVPDTEPWSRWSAEATALLSSVDVAIVDGTFYSPDELPGRAVSSIGHPLMTDTMDMLEERVRDGALVVYFTHFNHSNPVLDPGGPERRAVEARGFFVLDDGRTLPL